VSPGVYIHRDSFAELRRRVYNSVAGFHREEPQSVGIDLERLRRDCRIDTSLLDSILKQMAESGAIAQRSGRWALPDHDAALGGEDAARGGAIEQLFRDRGFRPPAVDEVSAITGIDRATVARLLRVLCEHQRLIRVEGTLLFHRDAVDQARERLVEFIRNEGRLESVRFKYLLDTSRKFAIPLLDYFDRIGVTRRDGHTRYLKGS
jgi:selenocysteine-specific elongation factor